MQVFCTSPWVPPGWIRAHGLEPRGIWLDRDFAAAPPSLAVGVCAFGRAAVCLVERQAAAAMIFTTHCDQLRRGFDAVAQAAPARVFLFDLPATWQTPVAQRIFCDELKRLGRFLIGLGGHEPSTGELVEIMEQYRRARAQLLEAARWCPARQYAEAVARFHLDGSVNLPPEPSPAAKTMPYIVGSGTMVCPFPLTPTLSLGERENPRQRVGEADTSGILERRSASLPLPKGEGRGEGEGRIGPACTADEPKPSCLHTSPEGGAPLVPLAVVGGPLPQSQMPLLDAIEKAGGRVVLNATEAGERSLWTAPPLDRAELGGVELLARTCLANCVDVFQRPNTRLYNWLRERLALRQARGVVLWHYVGCDLWRAEAQPMREAFGLPGLLLDAGEAELQRNTGRLEAFLESLR